MAHDEWWTKKEVYEYLCQKYDIYPELDAAATKENKLCDAYFCKDEDPNGLDGSWQGYKAVWLNPPNSELMEFILKSFKEWKIGAIILMIAPAHAFATKYFRDSIWRAFKKSPWRDVVIEPMIPRPEFLDHGKNADNGNRNSYMEIVLR